MSEQTGAAVTPHPHSADAFQFNDDLLLSEEDRVAAQRLYPAIYYALDHPELRAEFERIDPIANEAKARSRTWGCWAVASITVALLLAASEPIYAGCHTIATLIAVISGALGIAGAAISVMGVLHAGQKRDWLHNRLLTEQMRQFHFGTMLKLADLLLAGRRDEYLKRRADLFVAFQSDVLRRSGLHLDRILKERDEPRTPQPAMAEAADPDIEREWRAAYQRLRIERQIDYADYKLKDDSRLFSTFPIPQARYLGWTTAVCVGGLIVTHLVVIVAAGFLDAENTARWMHVIGVWFAIVALAVRTLHEGLQPTREIERYRHYGSAMRLLRQRFDSTATNANEALAAAQAVEHTSADEMVIFLRSGNEARFVM